MCIRDRVTCFEVHLAKHVWNVGRNLRILVAQFHNEAAKLGSQSKKKESYYKAVSEVICKYRPELFCCDANIALLETIEMIEYHLKEHSDRTSGYSTNGLPRVSLAAWFPYHFKNAASDGLQTPTCGLGIDSLGMFVITYPNDACTDTALAETTLYAGHDDMAVFRLPEEEEAWQCVTEKEDKFVRRFLPFKLRKGLFAGTGCPGQHFDEPLSQQ